MGEIQLQRHHWTLLKDIADFKSLRFQVAGHCMAPLLQDGAKVMVMSARVYLPGDVLAVQRPVGKPVLHRLIGVFPTKGTLRYLTQADNSPTPDGSVTQTAIVGKVCGGECAPMVVNVPLRHRVKAVCRFITFLASRLRQRTWSLLKTT